jgi:DNA-binding SARP family transcriptional activator
MTGGGLRFELLGPLRVFAGDHEVDCGSPQQALILSGLLLQVNAFVAIEDMIDSLWPDVPPKSATNTVQRHLGRIRRLFETHRNGCRGPVLLRRRQRYGIVTDALTVDLGQFRDLAGRAQGSPPQRRWELLAQAIRLWQGRVGADLPVAGPFAQAARAVEREYVTAVAAAADVGGVAGGNESLIPMLETALKLDPWNEGLLVRMIDALNAVGRPREALLRYANYCSDLSEEMGVDPGADLRAAFARVLALTRADGQSPVALPGNGCTRCSERASTTQPTVVVLYLDDNGVRVG